MGESKTHHGPDAVQRKAIAAAVAGCALEWYDFAVYGFFALTISKLFFPSDEGSVSLLLGVATFGVGFIMRPVGAIVLGSVADRHSRSAALSLTILLMVIGTAMIAFAPTYAQAGIWAPLMIVAARLIQGFSAGGEMGVATALLIESAPHSRRGLYGSWQQVAQSTALLFGSGLGALLSSTLTAAQMDEWGWRIPFMLGLVIGPIGWYIRRKLPEPEHASSEASVARRRAPLRSVLRDHRAETVAGLGITTVWTVCSYFFLVYMPTYAATQLQIELSSSLASNAIGLVMLLVLAPLFGSLSDRWGRYRIILVGIAGVLVTCYPAIVALQRVPSLGMLICVQLWMAMLVAAIAGPAPAAMAELFPQEVRSTGISIGYNAAVVVFGGFAPLIATWLIRVCQSGSAPAWYVSASAALSLMALAWSTRTIGAASRAKPIMPTAPDTPA
ncbi:MFS transporter [Cupriavidus consociatus]|uniref:MFS transporter n=1 Tax=Cupriavidus consociatus TaxID=2821357 RepID=UPI001AEB94CB|nr:MULTISPECIES: MFS transporter [unclassified Cupriavidus]MBP0622357.1 MFS transporter [Cupriavidus sp. LEh25]MDK2659039.1 MFS transporter [Cupriavidus sp. LEh21]